MGNLTGSSTADIDAPLERVWELVEDVEKAPEWQGGLKEVHALERDGVRLVGLTGGVKRGADPVPTLTPYQVLIVASLIQAESGNVFESPKIARVIYNRLLQGMPLGIDASIYYAVEEQLHVPTYTHELTVSQLHIDSPYNTRTRTGLPPTPISNPGVASIKAAAHPAHVAYLYYVAAADGCGEQVFSDGQAEFDANWNTTKTAKTSKTTKRTNKATIPAKTDHLFAGTIPATKILRRRLDAFKNCIAFAWMILDETNNTVTYAAGDPKAGWWDGLIGAAGLSFAVAFGGQASAAVLAGEESGKAAELRAG